jgi:hypothetical protein
MFLFFALLFIFAVLGDLLSAIDVFISALLKLFGQCFHFDVFSWFKMEISLMFCFAVF